MVGAVHEHHVQSDPADHDPADRLPALRVAAKTGGLVRDDAPLGGERAVAAVGGLIGGEFPVERMRELVLLPVRVERRERVLPLPHEQRPGERENAAGDQQCARDPGESLHQPCNARCCTSDARRRLRCASTSRRIVSRIGPRGGRSAALG